MYIVKIKISIVVGISFFLWYFHFQISNLITYINNIKWNEKCKKSSKKKLFFLCVNFQFSFYAKHLYKHIYLLWTTRFFFSGVKKNQNWKDVFYAVCYTMIVCYVFVFMFWKIWWKRDEWKNKMYTERSIKCLTKICGWWSGKVWKMKYKYFKQVLPIVQRKYIYILNRHGE